MAKLTYRRLWKYLLVAFLLSGVKLLMHHFTDIADIETMNATEFMKYYDVQCERYTASTQAENSPKIPCQCLPSTLEGRYLITFENVDLKELETVHPELELGGKWTPRDCIARFHVAVIVPYKKRKRHLSIFLKYIHPLLQRQKLAYRIFVIEQAYPWIFNKAGLMNVGYLEAMKLSRFDCVIFNDVDLIPEDDRNLYTCLFAPRHVGAYTSKYNYTKCCKVAFGGATMFTADQFRAINGHSNKYWGWGGEDDDMYFRTINAGFKIHRYPKEVSRFAMIPHGPDKSNPENQYRWKLRRKTGRYTKEGLSNLNYSVVRMENRNLFTWIYATIDMPRTI